MQKLAVFRGRNRIKGAFVFSFTSDDDKFSKARKRATEKFGGGVSVNGTLADD
jgi:hypothetical protein